MTPYADQSNDRSGAAFVKFASRLEDADLARHAVEVFFDPGRDRSQTKTAEAVLIDSVYLEAQKDLLPSAEAETRLRKMASLRILHGFPGELRMRPAKAMKKQASASKEDPAGAMRKIAEELVDRHGSGMTYSECRRQAVKYAGLAKEAGCEVPSEVRLYAMDDLIPNPKMADNLRMHKAACLRSGRDASVFDGLVMVAERAESMDMPGLRKMAALVDRYDAELGLRESKYGSALPNGLQTVFSTGMRSMLKEAIDCSTSSDRDCESMDKATIVAGFGENALNAVEGADGSIDRDRLKRVAAMLGGTGK